MRRDIGAEAAIERVGKSVVGVEMIIAIVAEQCVSAGAGREGVVARAAVEAASGCAGVLVAGDGIIARSAGDVLDVNMNDIARITIRTTSPLFFDPYMRNRITGSLILIDETTNETVGACMIVGVPKPVITADAGVTSEGWGI